MFVEKDSLYICGLNVDFNNVTDSDNPIARVCLRNTPCFKSFLFPPRLFL